MGYIENVKGIVNNTVDNVNTVVTTGLEDIKIAADGASDIIDTTLSNDNIITKGGKIIGKAVDTSGKITKNNYDAITNTAKNNYDSGKRIIANATAPGRTALAIAGSGLTGAWNLIKSIGDDDGEADFIQAVDKVDSSVLKTYFQNAFAIYITAKNAATKAALATAVNPALALATFARESKKIMELSNDIKQLKAECTVLIVQLEQISKKVEHCADVIKEVQSLLKDQSIVVKGNNGVQVLTKKLEYKRTNFLKMNHGIKNLISKLKEITSWEGGTVA